MAARKNLPVLCALFLALAPTVLWGGQKKKREEPKSQVQPLPPQPPAALVVDTDSLDFHLSPLLTTGALAAQIRASLNDLIRDTRGETIIKLRAFVAGIGDAREVQSLVTDLFTDHKLPLPVLTILQVGALGNDESQVVIEAVVSTHRDVNPNGLAFIFGQRGDNLTAAFERLRHSTEAAGVDPGHVLTCTCFTGWLENYGQQVATFRAAFPQAEVNIVQSVRDPANRQTACEAIGQLSGAPAEGPVVLIDSAHATLVHAQRLLLTGLQLTFGPFLDDGHTAFERLSRTADSIEQVETPVEVNAFALDPKAAALLRRTVSVAPGTFSVENIEGLQAIDATAGIEAIFAPGVSSPVIVTGKEAGEHTKRVAE